MDRSRSLLVALFLVTATASGCAFGDRHVILSYPPPAGPPSTALARAPRQDVTIIVARFTDDRAEKTVGEVRNGWGMHTADVLTDTDVTTWVAKAIARDLTAAGYTVRWATKETAAERVQLAGQVLTTYCRAMMEYEGDVSFFVQVSVDGRSVLNRRIAGRGGAGMNWAASESGYGESLALALRDAIGHLAADLQVAINAMPPPPPPAVPPPAPAAPAAAPSAAAGPAS